MGRANLNKKGRDQVPPNQALNFTKRESLELRRQRPTRNQGPSIVANVDVHGILFAVVAIVFIVYPLAQWALGL